MKTLLSLVVIISSLSAHAVYFDVLGACSKKPLHAGQFITDTTDSVGQISIDIFEANNIPYIGSAEGMAMIANSPMGLDAMEVLSDSKMRAYGWCFSINGVVPDILASKAFLTSQNDYISWFYAYSTYDSGIWLDYCVPSYNLKPEQFCK
jgi:hypothetical protein